MKERLNCVMDIGEQMLFSGAEVHRVEDSVGRMCNVCRDCRRHPATCGSTGGGHHRFHRVYAYCPQCDGLSENKKSNRHT